MRALLTATFLLATLLATLLAAAPATAAPPTTADPPDILTPTGPPEPQPCPAWQIPCDFTLPTLVTEPSEPPTTTPEPSTPPTTTSTDTGTAAGPGDTTGPVSPPAPAGTNWWLLSIPVLALLALAAAGAVLLIQRTERRPS